MTNNPPRKWVSILMIFFMTALCIGLIVVVAACWPPAKGYFKRFGLSIEQQLIVLVTLGGALGAFIQIAGSFTYHFGRKQFEKSWVSWYFIRPFIGAALALGFYFLLRGGLITVNADGPIASQYSAVQDTVTYIYRDTVKIGSTIRSTAESLAGFNRIGVERLPKREDNVPVNPFGVMGISFLVGLFSSQAVKKLSEIFDKTFLNKEGAEKSNKESENVKANEVPGSESVTDEEAVG
jgi:hypothetical protein